LEIRDEVVGWGVAHNVGLTDQRGMGLRVWESGSKDWGLGMSHSVGLTVQRGFGLRVYPGKPIFLSFDGNESYYTNALILLIRTNCVVIFVAIK
jgi:hypothetical protein